MSPGRSLWPADLDLHLRLGILPELLEQAGIVRVTDAEARALLSSRHSGDLAGIVYPYRDPATGARLTCRVRRDHPEIENGKPRDKYLSAFGDSKHLFFPPGPGELLADTSAPIIFVEAEKSVLAIMAAAERAERSVLVIGTGGCWGWRGRIGKTTDATGARVYEKGPLPDLARVSWTDRDTVILFDANAATNAKVQAARRALAKDLGARGARVRIAELPVEPDVNGPDDFRAKHGDAVLFALIDGAKPAWSTPKKEKSEKPKQGRDVQFEDPDPWPEPVDDGAALLDAIAATFERYLALPQNASTALALWVLHTYAFTAWFTSPFLVINSPVKRCGKTLLLIVLGAFVKRRLFASNVTPAVLFRTIEKYGPTLLIDEADTFMRDNDELRGVLNSGHTRTTAVVIRAVGDDHDPRAFSTWCPKAIALIGKLPGTLDDRSIEIAMRRRTAGERIERLRQDRIETECCDLRCQAARWAADHLREFQDSDPWVPAALQDRAADCWRPLLAIADVAGADWPARAREAALVLSGESAEDDATIKLLRDIRGTFAAAGDPDVLPSRAIVERLVALEDRPWREWSHGRPLSTGKLARLLANYGIHPAGTVRIGENTAKGYRRSAFLDAWDRYVSPERAVEASQRNDVNVSGPDPAFSNRHNGHGCDDLRSVTNPMNPERSYGVTVSEEENDASDDKWTLR